MTNDNLTLQITDLKKNLGTTAVLEGVSATFRGAEVTLLLGRNGAGKSTLLRICSGLLRADRGELSWTGKKKAPAGAIGYASHDSLLYRKLRVREFLELCQDVHGGKEDIDLSTVLKNWDLVGFQNSLIENLSKGVVARTSLCRATLFSPSYLFLDEPSSNLDDSSLENLRQAIERARSRGALVLIATHDLTRLGSLARRAVILNEGRFVYDSHECEGGCEELYERYRSLNR